jgi:stage II sporulation protein D
MSQWGAKKMAEEGWDYRKILGYYYPKTQLKRLYR